MNRTAQGPSLRGVTRWNELADDLLGFGAEARDMVSFV